MAISQQFSSILKTHPELSKDNAPAEQQSAPVIGPKFNPFSKFKKNGSTTPVQQTTIVPSAGTPFGKAKTVKQTVVVDEDSNDDDPALVAVVDKPFQATTEGDITFTRQKEEKVTEEVPVEMEKPAKIVPKPKAQPKEEKAEVKDLMDLISEEDKDPNYFKEKVEILRQRYVHEEFKKYQDEVFRRLEAIKITADLNTGTVKVRLADIAALRLEIFKHRVDIKMLAQCPLDKEHGDIYASAKIQAKGSNETERKSSYFQYLKNFPVKDGSVDIPFLTTVLDMYNIFFDAVLAELKVKQDILVTYTGNLKIDATIA